MAKRPTPDPVLVPLEASVAVAVVPASPSPAPVALNPNPSAPGAPAASCTLVKSQVDARQLQVDGFLQARSLHPRSQRAYQRDLQTFMDWTETNWNQVSRYQITQFKRYLLQEKQLAANSVNRILQTLKTFFKWLFQSGQVQVNPVSGIEREVPQTQAQDLLVVEVERIYGAIAQRKWRERDRLLWTLLLHGLRAEELVNLNFGDYAAAELIIGTAQKGKGTDQKVIMDRVPLAPQAVEDFNAYRVWREQREQQPLTADQPLFISFSPRSYGQRLTYWGIRQIIDQLAKATGIDLHANRGRQTFAARLILDLDFDPILAMELTRHRDLRSLKPYIDRRNEHKKLDTKQMAKQAFLQAMSRSTEEEMEKVERNGGKDEKNDGTAAPFD